MTNANTKKRECSNVKTDTIGVLGWESGPGGIDWDGRSCEGELKMAIPAKMGGQVAVVLYVVTMVAVIIGVDFVFFRN
jgi:hypothetical protein